MSVLAFPRIHFGGSCLIHQPTGNRNAEGNIDFTRNHLYRDGRRVCPDESVEAFYRYFSECGERYDARGAASADGEFSTAAGRDYMGNGRMLWNAEVTSCQLEFGRACPDPLVGKKVDLWGHFNEYIGTTYNQPKVVELDSTSTWTRQVYGGQFCLGRGRTSLDAGYLINGLTAGTQVARFHKSRHYIDLPSHWNETEIGRADLFQCVVARSELITLEDAIDSPCLARLAHVLASDPTASGLVIQFVVFNASSPVTPNTPTSCSLIGSVGVWREATEMKTFPAGRVLVPARPATPREGAACRGVLTLDLSAQGVSLNAAIGVPFRGRSEAPVRGPLHAPGEPAVDDDWFVLLRGRGAGNGARIARIGAAQLDAGFLARGGIIDAPFVDAAARAEALALAEGDIVIARRAESGELMPLYEERSTVVEADAAAIYLDVPDVERGLYFDESINIRSYVRGAPAQVTDIELEVVANPGVYPHQTPAYAPQEDRGPRLSFKMSDGGTEFGERLTFSTDEGGRAEVLLRARQSGSARVVLVSGERERRLLLESAALGPFERYDADDRRGVWASVGAFNVRVLPDDWDVYRRAETQMDFAFMYEHVLQFYELLYPFMNREVFSLADGAKCRAHAVLNWQMCDPLNRDKSYFMPPTRELSYAKALLFKMFVTRSAPVGPVPCLAPGGRYARR